LHVFGEGGSGICFFDDAADEDTQHVDFVLQAGEMGGFEGLDVGTTKIT
jgi:hypothetical protein